MKKFILTILATVAMLLCMAPDCNAGPGVHFGVFIGPPVYPAYYQPDPYYYGPAYYGYYSPRFYWHGGGYYRGYHGYRGYHHWH